MSDSSKQYISFLLCDRLVLMKNDRTVSLHHPACYEQSRTINLTKKSFSLWEFKKSLGMFSSLLWATNTNGELTKFLVVNDVTVFLWTKQSFHNLNLSLSLSYISSGRRTLCSTLRALSSPPRSMMTQTESISSWPHRFMSHNRKRWWLIVTPIMLHLPSRFQHPSNEPWCHRNFGRTSPKLCHAPSAFTRIHDTLPRLLRSERNLVYEAFMRPRSDK